MEDMSWQPAGRAERAHTYFAFISYSRQDKKWAGRIQRKLEQYSLPAALRKEMPQLPKNLRPVFRDMTDLSAGRLQDELQRQLGLSKKLIVVCSPRSAQSEWVDKEVRYFIESRGYDNVIPFIVDGAPGGGNSECLPESLRRSGAEQLLGVSVKELGWRDAFLRLVSGLLHVEFDSLRRRHEQRRKKRNLLTAAAASLFLLLSGAAGYAAWDYYAPHEVHYTDYVLRWGVPEGIGRLSEQEIAAMAEHYTIVTKKRRVVSLTHANFAGVPILHVDTERMNRPMVARYYYRDDGFLSTIEYMDRNERILLTGNYAPDLKAVDYVASRDDSAFQVLSSSSTSMDSGMFGLNAFGVQIANKKSDIARHAFEYDENGFVVKVVYMRDNRNTPVLDADGIGGLEYTLDVFGRPVETRFLGRSGEGYVATKLNIAGVRYAYDDAYHLIRTEYFNPRGAPVFNAQGWMVAESDFNDKGNLVKQSFFDSRGRLSSGNGGCAWAEWEYDDLGNKVAESYFGVDGRPVVCSDGYASVKYACDGQGNVTRVAYFDTGGSPVAFAGEAFSVMEMEYDERGNYVSISYWGADGEPVYYNGYASVKIEYDERGLPVMESCFDADGILISSDLGVALCKMDYDGRGNLIREAYFDAGGAPITRKGGIVASFERGYDERGNIIRESYFGIDGNPAYRYGYASYELEYDIGGNVTRVSYLGADGKPARHSNGYASVTLEYDERGNVAKWAYFDAGGAPAPDQNGAATITRDYDEDGDMVNEMRYNTAGIPVPVVIACVTEVFDGGNAAGAGIEVGDIIVRYGGWTCIGVRDPAEAEGLSLETEALRDSKKDLLIYKPLLSACLPYSFPPGQVGIRIVSRYISVEEYRPIVRAYSVFARDE